MGHALVLQRRLRVECPWNQHSYRACRV